MLTGESCGMRTHPVLSALAKHGVRLGLDRMSGFLSASGDPHLGPLVVHIAGTNGKGSTATMVTEVLVRAGYRVGTNLSPHLEHVNERFLIDGVPVSDAVLETQIGRLARIREDWARSQGMTDALTYFEFATALAFFIFQAHAVDVMVIEVGLGGRLDATNVVEPAVTAITSIGLDHVEQLGGTLDSIAREKAGIFKPGVPAVVGPLPETAMQAVVARAQRIGAPLWRPGAQLLMDGRSDGWWFSTPIGELHRVTLALAGRHQGANALVALGIVHRLRELGLTIPDEHVLDGLSQASIAGRIETLCPGLVVDGAHNEAGARALAAWLAARPRPPCRILLFGMGAGRTPHDVLGPLLPHVDEVVTTRCAHPKAMDSLELAQMIGEISPILADGGPIEQALPECFADAQETIVAGSLYLAGAARSLFHAGELEGLSPGMSTESGVAGAPELGSEGGP